LQPRLLEVNVCTASDTPTTIRSFTLEGTDLVTSTGSRFAFCASTDTLTLRQTSGSPSIGGPLTLRPYADVITPEICDGVDNDKNGVIDDKTVDCPTECNTKGVCAQVKQTCAGKSADVRAILPALEKDKETSATADNDCDACRQDLSAVLRLATNRQRQERHGRR
jgi:hypothetical protein